MVSEYAGVSEKVKKEKERDEISEAMTVLAMLYEDGIGVPKDEKKTLRLYHEAANRGHHVAQCALGVIYSLGRLVPKVSENEKEKKRENENENDQLKRIRKTKTKTKHDKEKQRGEKGRKETKGKAKKTKQTK